MNPLLAALDGAEHRELAGVRIDIVRTGTTRVGRVIYPPGFRWSTHMKPLVGTDQCEHAHVGFLASGRVQGAYPDGCTFDFTAPGVVNIAPGHDAWVVGAEPAVLVQFDAEGDTCRRFGLPELHQHG
jgi:hypothetical protein